MGATTAVRGLFDHRALPYRDPDELLAAVVPFVRDGLGHGDAVVVVLATEPLDALRDQLGALASAPDLRLMDAREAARNPGALLSMWQAFTDELHHSGRQGRAVAETLHHDWLHDRADDELDECVHYEAQLNLAFFSTSAVWTLLCPVDVAAIDPVHVEAAIRAHPHLHLFGMARPNVAYTHPGTPEALTPEPLGPPPEAATSVVFDASSLPELRALVADLATGVGLDAERTGDLVLAVAELAANSVLHGGGGGIARLWSEATDAAGTSGAGTAVCEVHDRGWIVDPLAGTRRPAPEMPRGRGLWLVHALCDLVQVRSDPDGTTVRVTMRR